LAAILAHCCEHLGDTGVIVIALATLETQAELTQWQRDHPDWTVTYQQLSFTRSVAVGSLTRWEPLNPVVLATLRPSDNGQ
jgi:precorrin-6Y C5,15-methyltransferase (decarboxylating)